MPSSDRRTCVMVCAPLSNTPGDRVHDRGRRGRSVGHALDRMRSSAIPLPLGVECTTDEECQEIASAAGFCGYCAL